MVLGDSTLESLTPIVNAPLMAILSPRNVRFELKHQIFIIFINNLNEFWSWKTQGWLNLADGS